MVDLVPLVGANGENWLTGYSYRRSLLVTNSSASVGTNYQVQIIVVNGISEGASTTYAINDTIRINSARGFCTEAVSCKILCNRVTYYSSFSPFPTPL
jgi:hypothetical protein